MRKDEPHLCSSIIMKILLKVLVLPRVCQLSRFREDNRVSEGGGLVGTEINDLIVKRKR